MPAALPLRRVDGGGGLLAGGPLRARRGPAQGARRGADRRGDRAGARARLRANRARREPVEQRRLGAVRADGVLGRLQAAGAERADGPEAVSDPLLGVQVESLREMQRCYGRAATGGGVIELPGAVACLTPGLGVQSLFNAAVFEPGADVPALLDELQQRFEDAGIAAWGAWAHDSDQVALDAFVAHGLALDSTPTAMGRDLDLAFEAPAGVDVGPCEDRDEFDAVTTAAW